MTSIPDHYQALGIDPTADPEVITAAYRALAKKFHPDTGAATGTASPERFDEIQQAYEVLRNPESRHAYDLELLAATEAELEQHIAAKRRVVVREPEPAAPPPPPPDLGDIRPEPAMPPRGRGAPPPGSSRRSPMVAFAIPLLLMFAVGGGAAWLFLPEGPAAPPQPSAPQATSATEAQPASPPAAKPEAKVDSTPAPAPAPAAADDGPPVFGSTGSESDPPEVEVAAATPADDQAPGAAASASNAAAKSDRPSFGSSIAADDAAAAPDAPAAAGAATAAADPAAAAPPPPVPKARPAQPSRPVAQQPKPAPKTQQQAQAQPRAKLTYQDPPRYNPQPDGYPPPGYPPPGYEPPGYDPGYDPRAQYDPPPGFEDDYPPPGYPQGGLPGLGPYRLVIFERQPGRQATAWSAGVVFKSIGKCTRQGVKAVLRRTGGMDPDGTRIWYECQQLSQR